MSGSRRPPDQRLHTSSEEGIFLLGDDNDLDELLGDVAAEANHEDDRRRQRRLDDAFQVLNRAIDAPRRA